MLSRREFLKSLAAGAAVVALPPILRAPSAPDLKGAGYSLTGYVGNGSSQTITVGFKPAMVLIKRRDGSGWEGVKC